MGSVQEDIYKFAFLVHPRDNEDIFKKFGFLRYAPQFVLTLIERYLPPVIVTNVTGLVDKQGVNIEGYIISIPMTAPRMLSERDRAVKQIRRAIKLARKKGVKMVGLGALTSSLTYGGKKLVDIEGISITTGHAYTGYNVTRYIFNIAEERGIDLSRATIGIVGAAGSIGGISTKILDRAGVKKLILVDLDRKLNLAEELKKSLKGDITITSKLSALKDAHFIITATNAAGALVKDEHVSPGTIIVDDAQPSDVGDCVLDRDDVVVLEAGAVETPGIKSNFNIGLHGEDVNYCCMAELLILASDRHVGNYLIGAPTLKYVDEIKELGSKLRFKLPSFQNNSGLVTQSHMDTVAKLLKERL